MQIQGSPYQLYEVIATTEPILHVINTIYSVDVPTVRPHYGSLSFNTTPRSLEHATAFITCENRDDKPSYRLDNISHLSKTSPSSVH